MFTQPRKFLPLVALLALVGCGGAASPEGAPSQPSESQPVQSAPAPESSAAPQPETGLNPDEDPVAADNPAALAEQIVLAETTVRDPASPPEDVVAAGRLGQVAYRELGRHPEWDQQVLAAVPADLHESVNRHNRARRDWEAMHSTRPDTVPAWHIVEPLPADQLLTMYRDAEQEFGVPWSVLAAINLVETGMGRVVADSEAGAQGPMQFMPPTWESYGMGGDVWDPSDAIRGAANYLAANGAADGDDEGLDNAIWNYNNDVRYVSAVREYAAEMAADERTFYGMHAWDVYYPTTAGDLMLPIGYDLAEPMPAEEWLRSGPPR